VSVYSGDGVRVRAVDGPAWDGDSWTITQRHEYGIENVFPNVSPSPRRTWRSDDTTAQNIVVQLDNTTDPGSLLSRVLFIAAFNCNFRTMTVAYRDTTGAGAWTTLGTLALNQGQTGLRWTRDGHTIKPTTGAVVTSTDDYFTYNILEDSHVLIQTAAAADVVRRIKANTEGAWSNEATVRARLYCADIAATDAASGTVGEIWSKDGALIIRDCPDLCELRFTIPGGITATGYFEIGSLLVGHVAYFGRQYARGRAQRTAPNTALVTGRGGARRAQNYGPSRRSVEFGWANENEIDASQLGGVNALPDYILPATGSAYPVATHADTAYKMAGLIEALQGSATTAVYFARVPMVAAESTDTMMVNRNLFMQGRLVSDVRIEAIVGDEWDTSGELLRVATVTFEEDV